LTAPVAYQLLAFRIKDINTDIMVWSIDKPDRESNSGLIIEKEEAMAPVRKDLDDGGERYAEISSQGKALYSATDEKRDALIGLTAYLKILRDEPNRIKRQIDKFQKYLRIASILLHASSMMLFSLAKQKRANFSPDLSW